MVKFQKQCNNWKKLAVSCEEPFGHISQRLLLDLKISITSNYTKICRYRAEKYGEVADQCGDAYLAYGSALLDLSRMESGVLGNALKGSM